MTRKYPKTPARKNRPRREPRLAAIKGRRKEGNPEKEGNIVLPYPLHRHIGGHVFVQSVTVDSNRFFPELFRSRRGPGPLPEKIPAAAAIPDAAIIQTTRTVIAFLCFISYYSLLCFVFAEEAVYEQRRPGEDPLLHFLIRAGNPSGGYSGEFPVKIPVEDPSPNFQLSAGEA